MCYSSGGWEEVGSSLSKATLEVSEHVSQTANSVDDKKKEQLDEAG